MKKGFFISVLITLGVISHLLYVIPIVYVIVSPFLTRHFFEIRYDTKDFEDFKNSALPAISNYLMFDDSNNTALCDRTISKYPFNEVYYHYKYLYDYTNTSFETVLLRINYDEEQYLNMYDEITSNEGFSSDVSFSENGFSFYLNKTAAPLIDYHYDDRQNYWVINWINLVGFSKSYNSIAFIGWRININNNVVFDYSDERWNYFYSWNSLINMYFEDLYNG